MGRIDPALIAAIQHRMHRDQHPILEDPDFARMVLHFNDTFARGVRDRVEVAANRYYALMTDPALDRQHGIVWRRRQGGQRWLLLGEVLADDPPRGRMEAHVGHRIQPVAELPVEVVGITEATAQEEVLADVAIWPLDLALGLCPVGRHARGRAP